MKKIILKLFILTTLCVAICTHTTPPTHAQTGVNLLGRFDGVTNAFSVQVVGSIAYVADRENGLVMVDVSDPTAPSLLGSVNIGASAFSVYVVGSVAYVANYANGLVTVDVSDPTTPSLLGSFNTAGEAFGVHVVGNVAYVADYGNGLATVDVSDPTTPSLLGSYDTDGYAYAECVKEDWTRKGRIYCSNTGSPSSWVVSVGGGLTHTPAGG